MRALPLIMHDDGQVTCETCGVTHATIGVYQGHHCTGR